MIVVEGSANIGFSGKRVVEQFQQHKVPEEFQHGTWLLQRGFVDEVVATGDLPKRVAQLLEYAASGGRLADRQTRRPRPWVPASEVAIGATSARTATLKRPARPSRRTAVGV